VPSRRSDALQALQAAATDWRRAGQIATSLQKAAADLRDWLESRPDELPPAALEDLDLTHPVTPGRRVVFDGAGLYVRLRLYAPPSVAWLQRHPTDKHLTATNPVELLWAPDPAERGYRCGALAFLQAAASGEGPALVQILNRMGLEAAAQLVADHLDSDGLYELGAGMLPPQFPSPRQLLQVAFKGRQQELTWLEEFCDQGGDHWEAPDQMEVPLGREQRAAQGPDPAHWIEKL